MYLTVCLISEKIMIIRHKHTNTHRQTQTKPPQKKWLTLHQSENPKASCFSFRKAVMYPVKRPPDWDSESYTFDWEQWYTLCVLTSVYPFCTWSLGDVWVPVGACSLFWCLHFGCYFFWRRSDIAQTLAFLYTLPAARGRSVWAGTSCLWPVQNIDPGS